MVPNSRIKDENWYKINLKSKIIKLRRNFIKSLKTFKNIEDDLIDSKVSEFHQDLMPPKEISIKYPSLLSHPLKKEECERESKRLLC